MPGRGKSEELVHSPASDMTVDDGPLGSRKGASLPLVTSRSSMTVVSGPSALTSALSSREPSRRGAAVFGKPTSEPAITVIQFDNTKAGLQTVDKAKTEAIITNLSLGSSFYLNEERKSQQRQRQVQALLEKLRVFSSSVETSPAALRAVMRQVNVIESELEAARRLDSILVHMDMDMFYAAVEEKRSPHLATVPLGIGGNSMLSTTNYVARQFGVRAGMPGFIGKKLCPALVIVPCNMDACAQEAAAVRKVAAHYDPHYVSIGLDELTMNITSYVEAHYPEAQDIASRYRVAEDVVRECRQAVFDATQLTVSAGIAPTGTLAKIASNYQKPNGQHVLPLFTRSDVVNFVRALDVRKVPGIGKSTEAILAGIGIRSVGDIYDQRYRLSYIFGDKTFRFLFGVSIGMFTHYEALGTSAATIASSAADGQGGEAVGADAIRKSVGQERTFRALQSRLDMQEIAYANLEEAHKTLVREGFLCSQVLLKLKSRSFHVKQYSRNITACPTDDIVILRRAVDELVLPVINNYADYRLLGVRLDKLIARQAWELAHARGVRQRSLGDYVGACTEGEAAQKYRKRRRSSGDVEVVVVSSSSQLNDIDHDSSESGVRVSDDDIISVGTSSESSLPLLRTSTTSSLSQASCFEGGEHTDSDDDVFVVKE